jgi:hypothetical protein
MGERVIQEIKNKKKEKDMKGKKIETILVEYLVSPFFSYWSV